MMKILKTAAKQIPPLRRLVDDRNRLREENEALRAEIARLQSEIAKANSAEASGEGTASDYFQVYPYDPRKVAGSKEMMNH